jgi:hypothetical protein
MDAKQYGRLNTAFLVMAEQANVPDVRGRWRALAHACQSLGKEPDLNKGKRSDKRLITKRITSRLAIAWAAIHSSVEFLVEPLATLL